MSLKIAETAEKQAQKRDLIETKYIGSYERFVGTAGEAFYNPNSDSWHYRPFRDRIYIEFGEEKEGFFIGVNAKDLECASDKGWLKGKYIGDRGFNREGKAFWNSERKMWQYRPSNATKEYLVLEGNFVPRRDEDVFDK